MAQSNGCRHTSLSDDIRWCLLSDSFEPPKRHIVSSEASWRLSISIKKGQYIPKSIAQGL